MYALQGLSRSHARFHSRLAYYLRRATFASVARVPAVGVIRPSKDEIVSGRLEPRNVEIGVRHLHEDGLVVVEDVMAEQHLDLLNAKMVQDARTLQARGQDGPFNYNIGNIQQDPPPVAKYFIPQIFTNPIATQLTSAVLGPRPKWTFCSANSALPCDESMRQPVHSDADFAHPNVPFALVVNVPLVTTIPDNGSTELWLGTHAGYGVEAQQEQHGHRASGRIREELLQQRESISPPIQPSIKKGSIIIRDLRLWHAGMPNLTSDVRVMLAMIHFASWYRNPMRLEMGADVQSLLTKLEQDGQLNLDVPIDYKDTELVMKNYLDRGFGNSYDFSQEA